MSRPVAVPTISLSGKEFLRDVHAMQAELRKRAPVYRATAPNGMEVWVVTRYSDARAAFTDPRLSKDAEGLRAVLGAKLGAAAHGVSLSQLVMPHLLHRDPPDHTRLRRLLASAFTTRRIELLRPGIASHVARLLDLLADRDEFDLLADFAVPLPAWVISELIGIPGEDQDDFVAWSRTYAEAGDPEETARAARSITGYLAGRLDAVRAEPKQDLLSALVKARDDGDRLSDEELLGTVFLLLVAGHETTANLIANGTLALLRDPALWDALRADVTLLPGAVEELLRFDGPGLMASLRFTAEPVEIGGTAIPAGEIVLVGLSAANRDPARFPEPDMLDLRRNTQGHLGFGHGVHFCIGASLARVEAELAFHGLLTRFPRLRLAVPPEELSWRPSMLFRGLHVLPVRVSSSR